MTTRRNYYGGPEYFAMVPGESTTHTNTTTEATIATVVIPANTLRVGDRIEIRAVTEADAANSTDTHTVNLKAIKTGSTAISLAAGAAVDVAAGDVHISRALLQVQTVGVAATASLIGLGESMWSTSGATHTLTAVSEATYFDTTSDLNIYISVDHSVAAAGNQTSVKVFDVIVWPAVA